MATSEGNEGVGDASAQGNRSGGGRVGALLLCAAVVTAAGVLALVFVDPILGAFLLIMGLTLLGIGAMARDWDRHPTYEDRELARARKRKEKWERGSAARERDRARWEAHQARQAKKGDR
jgi:hypothetical protein